MAWGAFFDFHTVRDGLERQLVPPRVLRERRQEILPAPVHEDAELVRAPAQLWRSRDPKRRDLEPVSVGTDGCEDNKRSRTLECPMKERSAFGGFCGSCSDLAA